MTSLGAANEIQAMAAGGKHMLVVTTTPAAAGLGTLLYGHVVVQLGTTLVAHGLAAITPTT